MTPLERLEAAAETWHETPIGSVAESDAAGEMYGAALAVLAAAETREAA